MAASAPQQDEMFLLRVPPQLAERLRRLLADEGGANLASEIELQFTDERLGSLRVGGDTFPAKLLDLPTRVESWKTLDDTNLVKSADIGQVIVVGPPGVPLPQGTVCLNGVTKVME
jgi:transcription initiation factor TFIID subunit 7